MNPETQRNNKLCPNCRRTFELVEYGFCPYCASKLITRKQSGNTRIRVFWGLTERLTPFTENGKWGFRDYLSNDLTINAIYDSVKPFVGSYAVVTANGKCGVIDKSGNSIIGCDYSSIEIFNDNLFFIEINGKKRLFSRTLWDWVSQSEVGWVREVVHNRFCVDKTGPELHRSYGSFLIDENGVIIHDGDYDYIGCTGCDNLIEISQLRTYPPDPTVKRMYYGCIDRNGKTVFECIYDYHICFFDGLARVVINSDRWEDEVYGSGGESIFINDKGQILYKNTQEEDCRWGIDRYPEEGTAFISGRKIINNTGKITVLEKEYYYTSSFNNGLAAVFSGAKWGFINKAGKECIPLEYEAVSAFNDGIALVQKNGKYGFLNKDGRVVVPLIHQGGLFINWDHYGFVDNWQLNIKYPFILVPDTKSLWWIYNFEGKLICKTDTNKKPIITWSKRVIVQSADKLFGMIDSDGKIVTDYLYTSIEETAEDTFYVEKGGKFGLMDKGNSIILPLEYDALKWCGKKGYYKAIIGNCCGVIDRYGSIIVDISFDDVIIKDDIIIAKMGEKECKFDFWGNLE